MKKIVFTILSFGLALISTNVTAQNAKSQSDFLRSKDVKGEYQVIEGSTKASKMIIKNVSPCKSDPKNHFAVELIQDADSPSKITTYHADSPVYVMTYSTREFYRGMAAKALGSDNVLTFPERKKLVFVKDYVFVLTDFISKDEYKVKAVLKKGGKGAKKVKRKKKGGFLSMMKKGLTQGMKDAKGPGKFQKEVLQPYLEAASVKLKKSWETPKGKAYKAEVAGYDAKFSAYGKVHNNAIFENKTGRTIYVYIDDSYKGGAWGPGSKFRLPCTFSLYYDFTGLRYKHPNRIKLLQAGGYTKNCGKTVQVK